ncbi:MAG: hypothetical protein IPH37_16960 [Burkholderiales bacterium]|nr:hypothetical protein [Burkholderiales bacterium]
MCTWLGVGNDPRYTPTTCFETFPFPAGLTPADTAHQRTETLDGGAVIPAEISEPNMPFPHTGRAQAATKNAASTTPNAGVATVDMTPASSHPAPRPFATTQSP